jgi:hypothetical protein
MQDSTWIKRIKEAGCGGLPQQYQLLRRQRAEGLWFEASLGKKSPRHSSQPMAGEVAYACHPRYTGINNRRIMIQTSPGKKGGPYPKSN